MSLELKKVVSIIFGWQLLVLISFIVGLHFLPIQQNYLGGSVHFNEAPLLWAHGNYDGEHYIEIAQFGYGPLRYFFFPLYPVLLRFVSHYLLFVHFPLIWSGIIISAISFTIGILVLYKLLRLDYSERFSIRTIVILLLFPTSFYFTAVYTEALFFVLLVSSLYFARKNNWIAAGILGIFASLTRLVGVFLVISLLVEWYLSFRKGKANLISIFPVLSVPLGLLFYAIFLQKFTGDPLAFFHNITTYGGQRSDHLVILPQVFYRYVFKILPNLNNYLPIMLSTYLEFATGFFFLIISIVSFVKVRASYTLFLLFAYLIPTFSGSFSSLPRYVLVLFPAFIVISSYLEGVTRPVRYSFYVISTVLLVMFTGMFAVGLWVS